MMYVVIIEDRHSDVEVRLFRSQGTARLEAARLFEKMCRFPDDPGISAGLDHWVYSSEGDCITIVEAEEEA